MTAVRIARLDGDVAELPMRALESLSTRLRGTVLLPSDAAFGGAVRIWNGLIAARPAVVVQPTSADDVAEVVSFAAAHSLLISVKGGGHNIAGTALADGGLTLDMAAMRRVTVDPARRVAQAGPRVPARGRRRCHPGARPRHRARSRLDDRGGRPHARRRVRVPDPPFRLDGRQPGGARGRDRRRRGPPGCRRRARGPVLGAQGRGRELRRRHPVHLPAARGRTRRDERLRRLGRAGGAPRPRGVPGGDRIGPPDADAGRHDAAGIPVSRTPRALARQAGRGRPRLPHRGSRPGGNGSRTRRPGRQPRGGRRGAQALRRAAVDAGHAQPHGLAQYWKSEFLSDLPDAMLAAFRDEAAAIGSPMSQMMLFHLAGALSDHEGSSACFGNRDAAHILFAAATWEPQDPDGERHRAWARSAWEAIRPYSTGGNYVNAQTADEGQARMREAYGDGLDRLVAVKLAYDPENLFRVNRNIVPGP